MGFVGFGRAANPKALKPQSTLQNISRVYVGFYRRVKGDSWGLGLAFSASQGVTQPFSGHVTSLRP